MHERDWASIHDGSFLIQLAGQSIGTGGLALARMLEPHASKTSPRSRRRKGSTVETI